VRHVTVATRFLLPTNWVKSRPIARLESCVILSLAPIRERRGTELGGATWFDDELAACTFGDQRLNKRLRKLMEYVEGAIGDSIPLACQDRANTKAAHRFLSYDRV
jgi:hypothetical protein